MYSIVQGATCYLSYVHTCSRALLNGLRHCSFSANINLAFSAMRSLASSIDAELEATASSVT